MPIVTSLTKALGIRVCVFFCWWTIEKLVLTFDGDTVLLFKEGCNGMTCRCIIWGWHAQAGLLGRVGVPQLAAAVSEAGGLGTSLPSFPLNICILIFGLPCLCRYPHRTHPAISGCSPCCHSG